MLLAALIYFAMAFAVGFVLGPIRIWVLEPRIGSVAAVLVEMPLILGASFLIARWCVARFAPGAGAGRRLAIGGLALAMLLGAELLLGLARGIGVEAFIASWGTLAGMIGLVGQVAFAMIPLLIRSASGGEDRAIDGRDKR